MLSKSHRILVVDDHRDTADLLARLLQSYGHSVQIANCGAAARETCNAHDFDVLLLDLGLPDCDGCELLRDLRRIKDVPAIAITGYAMAEDVQRCETAGFIAHIPKPFDLGALEGLLRQIRIEPRSVDRSVTG